MIRFSIREVVEQAVQTEKLGEEFYQTMVKKFHDNNELKKLFELLATHETRHGKSFAELEKKLPEQEPDGWDEVALYLKAIVDSEFFLGKDKCLPSMERVKTAAEAVDFALCFERETLLYYYALRETTKDKEILDRIISEERSHIVWLNNLKKSLTYQKSLGLFYKSRGRSRSGCNAEKSIIRVKIKAMRRIYVTSVSSA